MENPDHDTRPVRFRRWKIRLAVGLGIAAGVIAGSTAWDRANYPLPWQNWLETMNDPHAGLKGKAVAWVFRFQADLQRKKRFRISRNFLRTFSFENSTWIIGEHEILGDATFLPIEVKFETDTAVVFRADPNQPEYPVPSSIRSTFEFESPRSLTLQLPDEVPFHLEILHARLSGRELVISARRASTNQIFFLMRRSPSGENLSLPDWREDNHAAMNDFSR